MTQRKPKKYFVYGTSVIKGIEKVQIKELDNMVETGAS